MSIFERPCTRGSSRRTLILGVGALLLLALALGACQPAATPEPTEPPPPPTAKPTEPPEWNPSVTRLVAPGGARPAAAPWAAERCLVADLLPYAVDAATDVAPKIRERLQAAR